MSIQQTSNETLTCAVSFAKSSQMPALEQTTYLQKAYRVDYLMDTNDSVRQDLDGALLWPW